jgi:hypothetical protein
MPLSLVIFEDTSPDDAHPLLATHDPVIIAAVRRMLMERLGDPRTAPVMQLVPSNRRKRPKREVSTDVSE